MDRVFAIMPFGTPMSCENKNIKVDYDSIYNKAIKPACEELGLSIIRADEEISGGIIHRLMFERLVCANIAIVDVSNQNANVCYELGFRHCARENHTIIIFDKNTKLPFDFSLERAIPYQLNKGILSDKNAKELKEQLKKKICDISKLSNIKDSPAFELIEGFPTTTLEDKALDLYRKHQGAYESCINDLKSAKNSDDIKRCLKRIKKLNLSLKSVAYHIVKAAENIKDFNFLIEFIEKLQYPIKNITYFKQRLAFAYNKRGQEDDKDKAIRILGEMLENGAASSETYGLLGSVYKTKMAQAKDKEDKINYLNIAIKYYKQGFNCDINDYYPGINLATLLLEKNVEDNCSNGQEELQKILLIVKYDLEIQDTLNSKNYWALATLYEAHILSKCYTDAAKVLDKICELNLEIGIADWEKETTLKNLARIKEIYKKTDYQTDWYEFFRDKLKVKEENYVLD